MTIEDATIVATIERLFDRFASAPSGTEPRSMAFAGCPAYEPMKDENGRPRFVRAGANDPSRRTRSA